MPANDHACVTEGRCGLQRSAELSTVSIDGKILLIGFEVNRKADNRIGVEVLTARVGVAVRVRVGVPRTVIRPLSDESPRGKPSGSDACGLRIESGYDPGGVFAPTLTAQVNSSLVKHPSKTK